MLVIGYKQFFFITFQGWPILPTRVLIIRLPVQKLAQQSNASWYFPFQWEATKY